jgi:antitoxin component YwqK of YwqJK toxin-antitoxin module
MKKLYPLLSVLFLIGCNVGEEVIEYYDNGNIRSKGVILQNGEKNGQWVYFFENGDTLKTERYYKGKLNGFVYQYHQNGNKSGMGEYKNGVKVGNWFVNNEEGEWIIWENFDKDGKLDGYLVFRNEKGEIEHKQSYSNGVFLHIEVFTYNEEGKLEKVTTYDEDKKVISDIKF